MIPSRADQTPPAKVSDDALRRLAYLEAQIDSSLDGIVVVDTRGRRVLQNQRFIEIWQLPAHLIDSEDEEARMQWAFGMMKNPGPLVEGSTRLLERPYEKSRMEIALKNGTVLEGYSAPVVSANGTLLGRTWTVRDISGRKRMEEALRESEARFQRITDNVPGMVYQFLLRSDGTAVFTFVSEGCREVYGVEPERLYRDVGFPVEVVLPEDRESFVLAVTTSRSSARPLQWQGRILRPDSGQTRHLQISSRPEQQANGDVIWDGVILDITERVQFEGNRRAKEEAERTNRAKSQFLSRVSHELRTPLNAILGFSQVLELNDLGEQENHCVSLIIQAGRHLLSLVDEVLDLSRVEAGELQLVLGEVAVGKMVGECVGLVERLARTKSVQCRVELASYGARVHADELRLRQVLLNLLSNAIKYNVQGGSVLLSSEPRPGGFLRLSVTDTGPGISPEDKARLFVPFGRLERELGQVEGTGLGLTVARRLAEAMGGRLDVDSEVGRGSMFWVELPMVPGANVPAGSVDAADLAARLRAKEESTSPPASLLYIEDNSSNQQVVGMLLSKHRPNWPLLIAHNGLSGLELARRVVPGVVLLDLQLPGLGGEAVLAEIRRDPRLRQAKVIIITADATWQARERLLAAGADDYVVKPFDLVELLSKLDAALETSGT